MTDKMTKTQQRALMRSLELLHAEGQRLEEDRAKRDLIPPEWYRMDELAPCVPKKTKITIRLDGEMVRWFRHLGNGWHGRMEMVLLAYMQAALAGEFGEG